MFGRWEGCPSAHNAREGGGGGGGGRFCVAPRLLVYAPKIDPNFSGVKYDHPSTTSPVDPRGGGRGVTPGGSLYFCVRPPTPGGWVKKDPQQENPRPPLFVVCTVDVNQRRLTDNRRRLTVHKVRGERKERKGCKKPPPPMQVPSAACNVRQSCGLVKAVTQHAFED